MSFEEEGDDRDPWEGQWNQNVQLEEASLRQEGDEAIPSSTTIPMRKKEIHGFLWAVGEGLSLFVWGGISLFRRKLKGCEVLPYHRRKDHMLEQCVTFRKTLDEKHKMMK